MFSWGPDPLAPAFRWLCLAALLPGCSQLPAPSASRVLPTAGWLEPGHPGGTALEAAWWTLFSDPGLDEIVPLALANQPDLLAAQARAGEAHAQARSARARAWPSIQFKPGAQREEISANDAPDGAFPGSFQTTPFNRYETPLSASYAIDLFGRLRQEGKAIRSDAGALDADLEAARLLLTGEVIQAYFLYQSLVLDRDLMVRTIAHRTEEVAIQQSLVDAGKANEQAVAQARLELARLRMDEAGMTRDLRSALHSLAILCGQPPAAFAAPQLRPLPEPPRIPSGVPADILARRPDLIAARKRFESALWREEAAKRAYFPTIQLTATGGYASTDLSQLIRPDSLAWSVGAGLAQTIFDGGLRQANIQASRARYEQAVAQYDSTLLTAFREVEDALSLLAVLQTEKQEAANADRAARALVDIALARYRDGLSPYDPVMEANRSLLEISRREIQIDRAHCDGTIQLIVALGGAW